MNDIAWTTLLLGITATLFGIFYFAVSNVRVGAVLIIVAAIFYFVTSIIHDIKIKKYK